MINYDFFFKTGRAYLKVKIQGQLCTMTFTICPIFRNYYSSAEKGKPMEALNTMCQCREKISTKKPKKEYKRILFSILKHGISWNAIVFRNLFMAFLAPLHAMEYKKQCYNIIVHIPKLVVEPLHCCIMVKASTRFFLHSAHPQHRKYIVCDTKFAHLYDTSHYLMIFLWE